MRTIFRFIRHVLAAIVAMGAGLAGLLAYAGVASARPALQSYTPGDHPMSTSVSGGGVSWWVVLLIALGAAAVAVLITAFAEARRYRRRMGPVATS